MLGWFRKKETRSVCPSWAAISNSSPVAAFGGNPAYFESLSAVAACVSLVSSSLASCPALIYRTNGNIRTEAPEHALSRLIRNGVNSWQSWHDFIEFSMRQLLLRGNAFAHVVCDGMGRVVEIRPYDWGSVSIETLRNGRVAYTATDNMGIWGAPGTTVRLLPEEVLHIRDSGDNVLIGQSRISRSAAVFSGAMAVQEFAGAVYGQGIRPSGALEIPTRLDADARHKLTGELREFFSGSKNTAKAMVLENGMHWNPFEISAEDAEALASRQFSVEEICRIFSVPPPLIGDLRHGTFQNSETAGRWFASFCLAPLAHKLENSFRRSLLAGEDRAAMEIVIDLSGLTRGDNQARWTSHVAAVQAGILLPDEVRELEGWNPLPGERPEVKNDHD